MDDDHRAKKRPRSGQRAGLKNWGLTIVQEQRVSSLRQFYGRCSTFRGTVARWQHALSGAARILDHFHKTFGRSGHIKSQRSCMLCASRLGQSPLSCSFNFIMFALRPYFSISLWTWYRPLRLHLVHSTRSTSSLPSRSPKMRKVRGHGSCRALNHFTAKIISVLTMAIKIAAIRIASFSSY
jgi:hypothetical protein